MRDKSNPLARFTLPRDNCWLEQWLGHGIGKSGQIFKWGISSSKTMLFLPKSTRAIRSVDQEENVFLQNSQIVVRFAQSSVWCFAVNRRSNFIPQPLGHSIGTNPHVSTCVDSSRRAPLQSQPLLWFVQKTSRFWISFCSSLSLIRRSLEIGCWQVGQRDATLKGREESNVRKIISIFTGACPADNWNKRNVHNYRIEREIEGNSNRMDRNIWSRVFHLSKEVPVRLF